MQGNQGAVAASVDDLAELAISRARGLMPAPFPMFIRSKASSRDPHYIPWHLHCIP